MPGDGGITRPYRSHAVMQEIIVSFQSSILGQFHGLIMISTSDNVSELMRMLMIVETLWMKLRGGLKDSQKIKKII